MKIKFKKQKTKKQKHKILTISYSKATFTKNT